MAEVATKLPPLTIEAAAGAVGAGAQAAGVGQDGATDTLGDDAGVRSKEQRQQLQQQQQQLQHALADGSQLPRPTAQEAGQQTEQGAKLGTQQQVQLGTNRGQQGAVGQLTAQQLASSAQQQGKLVMNGEMGGPGGIKKHREQQLRQQLQLRQQQQQRQLDAGLSAQVSSQVVPKGSGQQQVQPLPEQAQAGTVGQQQVQPLPQQAQAGTVGQQAGQQVHALPHAQQLEAAARQQGKQALELQVGEREVAGLKKRPEQQQQQQQQQQQEAQQQQARAQALPVKGVAQLKADKQRVLDLILQQEHQLERTRQLVLQQMQQLADEQKRRAKEDQRRREQQAAQEQELARLRAEQEMLRSQEIARMRAEAERRKQEEEVGAVCSAIDIGLWELCMERFRCTCALVHAQHIVLGGVHIPSLSICIKWAVKFLFCIIQICTVMLRYHYYIFRGGRIALHGQV